jgi:hypothetical protein
VKKRTMEHRAHPVVDEVARGKHPIPPVDVRRGLDHHPSRDNVEDRKDTGEEQVRIAMTKMVKYLIR